MKHYGLIGKDLRNSWSQQYFETLFQNKGITDCRYRLYSTGHEVESPGELHLWLLQLLQDEQLQGFNVTMPYKAAIIPYLHQLSPEARAIGAVNCVAVTYPQAGAPYLTGHNTDAPAFEHTLRPLLKPWHTSALIFGTGGAAQAIGYVLLRQGIDVTFVSRHPQPEHPLLQHLPQAHITDYATALTLIATHYLLVNCTPVGMPPWDAETPLADVHNISFRHLCYDVIYNPEETRFLLECELAGAQIHGGLDMLHRQADLSWQIWAQE